MRLISTISKLKYGGEIRRVNEPFEARDCDIASLMACGCVPIDEVPVQSVVVAKQVIDADCAGKLAKLAQNAQNTTELDNPKPIEMSARKARKTRKKAIKE